MRHALSALACLTALPALAEAPVVVTDTPVVHSLAAQVMGDLGTPVVLLEPGADPHSFQLRPSQAAALSDAALVLWVGDELMPGLARALGTVPTGARTVALLDVEGTRLLEFGSGAHGDDHDHDHAEADGHAHGDHAIDPHAWLDPANAKLWLTAIAAELGRADPGDAATYAANAAAAAARIDATAAEARAILADVADRPIVTFHDAYGYFARAFDVPIAGSIALGDAAAPGARRIRDLEDRVGASNIACVFREPQHDPSLAEQIASAAGIGLGTLDPAGSSLDFGPGLYDALILGMATSIATCVRDGA